MIKILGEVMVICSGIGFGFSFSSKVKRHIRDIEAINHMFDEIIMMMKFNAVTFKDLIIHLRNCPHIRSFKFLDVDLSAFDIRESILKSINNNFDNLNKYEADQLYSFFLQLGLSDLDGQLLMAEKYHEFFQLRLENLREEGLKKCRLYNSLGVLGGAFIAVIFV